MLGTARLLTFSFRALALLIIISVLWMGVAGRYNDALVSLANPLAPGDTSVKAIGVHILISSPDLAAPVSIDGLTLHYGLILMAVIVLAAVGIGFTARVKWLIILGIGGFAVHVVGVALLGFGVAWAAGPNSPDVSGKLVFSLFAVFWGLLPAVAGGFWCYLYWLPRAAQKAA